VNSLIVGVDLSPIKAIPRVISFQSDITTDKCRATIRSHFKTWKADTVLHDGAPNVGTAWVQDSFNQAELALQAMKLATEFLVEGGTFVTKVFRSKDYNSLLWVFNQLFTKVEATKPPSSRNVSAEIFVVCQGFKAPKRIDPKFLDPRSVFAELSDPTPNNEAKVFNPEIKKRKRDGYEDGNMTQFREVPASEFIQTTDPIAMLGSLNRFSFDQPSNGDVALAALEKLPETTQEIRDCCKDLRVLGRKEFRSLLRWRLKVRVIFGFATKKDAEAGNEEVAEIEPMDEELKIQEELQALSEKESGRRKRERRRENEKKQREIIRMQLHMTAPTEIGLEQEGPNGEGSMFKLKSVDKSGAIDRIAKGKMALLSAADSARDYDSGIGMSGETDDESDPEEDKLEGNLDDMYEQYQTRKSETDAKFRAKKARKEHEDGDWEGFSADGHGSGKDEDSLDEESSEDESSEEKPITSRRSLLTDLVRDEKSSDGLSRKAAQFFDQDIFKNIEGLVEEESVHDSDEEDLNATLDALDDLGAINTTKDSRNLSSNSENKIPASKHTDGFSDDSEDEDSFEVVRRGENQWEDQDTPMKDGRMGKEYCPIYQLQKLTMNLDIDIITAEAMTLAQQMASGEKTQYDLIDDGFNKYTFKDRDGLPEWFLDDEGKHDRPHRPITAAGAAAIKEKLRALNARPIKKVREAKDRKKFKAAQRLEKLRKKSALLNDEEGMTEKEKAQSIVKLMSKATKKKPKQEVKVVVARGGNRGIAGRPRGVKGKYKIVDARLKKDVRGEKRAQKKRK
jgi:AdoMet-dependent rRNA methyltransferase SPB1